MKPRIRPSILTLVLVLTLAFGGMVSAQGPETVVSVQPAEQTVAIGETTTVEVWASSVTNFYGAQFMLTFDETIVEGVSVEPGTAFTDYPDEYEVVVNEVVSGTVTFAATLLRVPKAGPLTGDVQLATLSFTGLEEGVAALSLSEVKLSDSYGQPIAFAVEDGSITVECQTVLSGSAYLEGREDHSGVTVTLESSPVMSTTTDAAGAYAFTGVPSGNYTITMSAPFYLDAVVTDVEVVACETNVACDATLLGGDLNGDGVIDILDLSTCAAHFGTAAPEADVNADGIVDVYDLVLMGKNFKLEGPTVTSCLP